MEQSKRTEREGTAFDLLEREDLEIRRLFAELAQSDGPSVDDRFEHGALAKQLVRHVATRESALTDVIGALQDIPELSDLSDRMDMRTEERRSRITEMEKMSRGIQGMNLNTGQDFDGAVDELAQLLVPEIEWEISAALPKIRARTDESTRDEVFQSAHHTIRHAPTNLSPHGRRWYERAPVISRLITVYDHLRDFPKATTKDRR